MQQDGPHRRRRQPVNIEEIEELEIGQTQEEEQAGPETEQPAEPIKIVVTHEDDTPDWMVSAHEVSGAAQRRTKTERKETKEAETQTMREPIFAQKNPAARDDDAQMPHEPVFMKKKPAAQQEPPRMGYAQYDMPEQDGEDESGQEGAPAQKPAAKKAAHTKKAAEKKTQAGKPAAKKQAKKPPVKLTARERRRAQRIKKNALTGLACCVLLALIVLGAMGGARLLDIKQTLDRGDGVFYPNIFVNGIPLEGKTLDQAASDVTAQVTSLLQSWRITLRTQDGRSWDITGDDLKMKYDVADQLDQLWTIGHVGSSQERYEAVKKLEEEPEYAYTTLTYDMSAVNQIVTQIKNEVDRAPVNATRVFVEDKTVWPPYTYTDDVPGVELDISGLNEQIMGMVDRLESGTVDLTPVTVEADITREYLEGQIVKLSSFETSIGKTGDYVESRHENIRVGTERFDRLIIKSGETVSFNKVALKRTTDNGYWPALEIAYGEYVEGVGGGICQVSSTLYNAVANAGLEIVKRTPHAIPSSYVEKGLDATVSDDRYDFVFKNSTNAEIFIQAEYYHGRDNYWRTKFTIWGRPDPNGYTYKLESKVVEEIPLPEPEYRQDKDGVYVIYDDEEYQYSKGREGYVVEAYLVTRDSSGLEISRELKYTDTYKPAAPVVYVGVTPRETPVPYDYIE